MGAAGVRVNVLVPGFFPAEQNRKVLTPERVAQIMGKTPMKRFGEPHELVGAALLLASDAGSFITGAKSSWTADSMRCRSSMKFCDKDFLLSNRTARELYHGMAAEQPIIDYHCHLSPRDLAEDRRFENLHEPWLDGDHYKWRAMRANGVPEKLITGSDTTPREKFQAWAVTVPKTLRNPLFHWTHLEFRRYFGIEKLLERGHGAGQFGTRPTVCWRNRVIRCEGWWSA